MGPVGCVDDVSNAQAVENTLVSRCHPEEQSHVHFCVTGVIDVTLCMCVCVRERESVNILVANVNVRPDLIDMSSRFSVF